MLRPLLALVLACLAATRVHAASVFLEELTWTELRDALKAGSTTVLVPIGGTEQNGPAMALGKHNARARLLAERIAGKLGRALVAPVDPYVPEGSVEPPTAHMRFPGTITVPEPAFDATLESIAKSLRHHGFKDIVLLGDHGGYARNLARVAERLNRAWAGSGARVHVPAAYYGSVETAYPQALRAQGFRDDEIGSHAGLADTALTLALDPSLVRREALASRKLGPADGVSGDPARASADLGRLGVELIVDRTVAELQQRLAPR